MSSNINWVPKKDINFSLVNELLQKSIDSNHFTNNGPNVQYLEKYIKEQFKIENKSVICVTNGSVALHALYTAISCTDNIKVNWATQSFTFPPSAQGSLRDTKIVDIDEEGGLNLNEITKLNSTLSKESIINGIIVTNVFGNVVNINKYLEWLNEGSRYLIFDNAASGYSFYQNKNVNNYGTGSIISFHHTKPLGFGEGGAIIVDPKYELAIRRIINFGLDNNNLNISWHRDASNYKMSDISATYILQYLYNLKKINEKHQELYSYMKEKIDQILKIKLYPNFGDPLLSCFCLLFDEYNDNIRLELLDEGIYCRKYYKPLENTLISTNFYNSILCVPCTVDMTTKDIDRIINIIK